VPPGYKLVPAPGPTQDMPGYQGSRPTIDMNLRRQGFSNDRQDLGSDPDVDKKLAPKSRYVRGLDDVPRYTRKFNTDQAKVFVGGLGSATTAETLKDHFSQFGKVLCTSVIKDPATKRGRGFGFVEFEDGFPAALFESEHVIDQRTCGVKPYSYEWSYVQ
jgi:hypothetical protein